MVLVEEAADREIVEPLECFLGALCFGMLFLFFFFLN